MLICCLLYLSIKIIARRRTFTTIHAKKVFRNLQKLAQMQESRPLALVDSLLADAQFGGNG
jgi:hypothetical protein